MHQVRFLTCRYIARETRICNVWSCLNEQQEIVKYFRNNVDLLFLLPMESVSENTDSATLPLQLTRCSKAGLHLYWLLLMTWKCYVIMDLLCSALRGCMSRSCTTLQWQTGWEDIFLCLFIRLKVIVYLKRRERAEGKQAESTSNTESALVRRESRGKLEWQIFFFFFTSV